MSRLPLSLAFASARWRTQGGIESIEFYHKDYRDWQPHDTVIYCDPPYADTDGYREGSFDSQEFWALMEVWRQDNIVLVSEQEGRAHFPELRLRLAVRRGKRSLDATACTFCRREVSPPRARRRSTRPMVECRKPCVQ